MVHSNRVPAKQVLREAEGALELTMLFGDRWQPLAPNRDRLATYALTLLSKQEFTGKGKAQACYLTGLALRIMERYEEAIKRLEEAARLDSEDIHARLALGWCYKRTSQLELAIQALEEALPAAPREAILYYNLACYWSLMGKAHLAIEYLSQAFEIDSDYRDLVDAESDFDPIRKNPDFRSLTSAIA